MKRALRILGLTVLLLIVLFVGFFFWASSGPLPEDRMAVTTTYDAAPAAPRDTLTALTYNIGYLSGMTNNEPVVRPESLFVHNMDEAARLLRQADADIVGFQEIDFGAARSDYAHQLDTLATRLGYAASATAVNWDERYVPFPYSADPAVHFGRVLSGQAVLSRYPIRRHERIELARTSRPFWSDAFYLDRLAQIAEIDIGDDTIVVINVHLEAFEEATRETQAAEVRRMYQRYADRPVLLIGDFNAVWPAAQDTTRPDPDETLRLLLDGTDLRAAIPDSATTDSLATYPADAPTRKIDYIFYTPDRIEALDAFVTGGGANPPSDHRAVGMRFVLTEPRGQE
jgi:endonuclease/exonuclease/phosphatase family metal-dependent hydrolase